MLWMSGEFPHCGRAMKLTQRLQSVVAEVAFAAAAAGVVAVSMALFSVAAPRQVQDLCVSARAMAEPSGFSWSCGASDHPVDVAPPGQAILGH